LLLRFAERMLRAANSLADDFERFQHSIFPFTFILSLNSANLCKFFSTAPC
jgi:hypothetical protein